MRYAKYPLIHPGEILLKDWLEPLGISQYASAKAINVPRRRIDEIVQGHRAITADNAARLGALSLASMPKAGSHCRPTTTRKWCVSV